MVLWRVFKIAVLHQFGIQTSIGCIAYVLEENTYQFVAYLLLLAMVNINRCFN